MSDLSVDLPLETLGREIVARDAHQLLHRGVRLMVVKIPASMILRSLRERPRSGPAIAELAASIKEVGLLNPISARRSTVNNGFYNIIAGHHRHEAMLSLQWGEIPCIVLSLDGLRAELAEIDENLCRTNLTPAQEAEAIARRKTIYEELHPETRHGGDRKSGQVENISTCSFAEATAKAIGKTSRSVRTAVARGEALGADAEAITGTSLDSGVEIDALVKLPASERADKIERARAGEKVSARKPPVTESEPVRLSANLIRKVGPDDGIRNSHFAHNAQQCGEIAAGLREIVPLMCGEEEFRGLTNLVGCVIEEWKKLEAEMLAVLETTSVELRVAA